MSLRFGLALLTSLLITSSASAQLTMGPRAAPNPGTAVPAQSSDPPPLEPAPSPSDLSPRAAGHRVWLSTDVWPAKDFVIATMSVGAQIAAHRNVALDLELPWAFDGEKSGFPTSTTRTHAGLGNPTLGLHGVVMPLPTLALSFGATVTIPTRLDYGPSSHEQLFFMSAVATSRGFYDAHRFGPEVVFVRGPVGLEWRFLDIFYLRTELNPEIWVPAGSQVSTKSLQILVEHADEVEARAHVGFGGGLRAQAAFACTDALAFGPGPDRAQAALEPFLGYEPPGRGLFGRFGLLFALDSPLGFGFKTDRLAVLRAQIGGKF